MKKKIFKSFSIALFLLLATVGISNAMVGDKKGCIIDPEKDKVGVCMETTEGLWKCVAAGSSYDCTSSD